MSAEPEPVDVVHLKEVSRIKHLILAKYLPAWSVILGSRNSALSYFDCYAGPGIYELQGQLVEGSPVIAVRAAKEVLIRWPAKPNGLRKPCPKRSCFVAA